MVLFDVKPPHIMVGDNYPPAISTKLPHTYTLSRTAGADGGIEMEMGLRSA